MTEKNSFRKTNASVTSRCVHNVLLSKYCHFCPSEPVAQQKEAVSSPSHYTSGIIEVIDFIEDQKLGMHLGNAIKYISRYGKKNGNDLDDLHKAIWYLQRFITLNTPTKK